MEPLKEEAEEEASPEKTDKAMYEGLLKKITNVEFTLDCDALQGLSE